VTGMVLILAKGARSLEKSQLGLISSACNDGCESTASSPAGGEESDRPSSHLVKTSSQRSMAASQDL
jgi:hypothetical protein